MPPCSLGRVALGATSNSPTVSMNASHGGLAFITHTLTDTTIMQLRHVTSYLDSRLLGPISRGPVSVDSRRRASLKATSSLLQVAEGGCQQAVKCLRDLYIRLKEISTVIGRQEPPSEQGNLVRVTESAPDETQLAPRRRSSTDTLLRLQGNCGTKRWAQADSLFNTYDHRSPQQGRTGGRPTPIRIPEDTTAPHAIQSAPLPKHPATAVETPMSFNGTSIQPRDIGSNRPRSGRTVPSSPSKYSPKIPRKSSQRPGLRGGHTLPYRKASSDTPVMLKEAVTSSWNGQVVQTSSQTPVARQLSILPGASVPMASPEPEVELSLQARGTDISGPASQSHRLHGESSKYMYSVSQCSAQRSLRSSASVSALSDVSSLRRSPSDVCQPLGEKIPFSFEAEPLVESPTTSIAVPMRLQSESMHGEPCNNELVEERDSRRTASIEVEMHATVRRPVDCWTPTIYSLPDRAGSDSTIDTMDKERRDEAWFDDAISDASSTTTDLHSNFSVSSITTATSRDHDLIASMARHKTRDPHSSMIPQERPQNPFDSITPQIRSPTNGRLQLSFASPKHEPQPTHPSESALPVPALNESPILLPVPSARNNYFGFCIGAYLAQTSSPKAMVARRAMNVHHSKTTILKCSNSYCVFSGAGSDSKVWSAHGIRFRRPFLIKSHCAQKRVRKAIYSFQCPICVFFLKLSPGVVIKGTDKFLEHVATHRGLRMPVQVLERLRCVSGRRAGDDEEFDVNILPAGMEADTASAPMMPLRPAPLAPAAKSTSMSNTQARMSPWRQSSGISELKSGGGVERNSASPVSELM